jgi:hypothetical protein
MAFNLTRAAGTLASALHARATTGTIRAQLIHVPARLARSGRRLTLHQPRKLAIGAQLAAAARWQHRTTARGLTRPPSDRTDTDQMGKSRSARQHHHARTTATHDVHVNDVITGLCGGSGLSLDPWIGLDRRSAS